MRMLILDDHDVMPVVAEVIHIVKTTGIHTERLIQCDATFVALIEFCCIIRVGIAVGDAGDDKLVKMAVGPTEGNLQDPMQFRQLDCLGYD